MKRFRVARRLSKVKNFHAVQLKLVLHCAGITLREICATDGAKLNTRYDWTVKEAIVNF